MIGIETLPGADEAALLVDESAPVEYDVVLAAEESARAVGDELAPAVGDEPAPASESPDDLLRRLEEEKQEWQRQLAAMKETLEAQDRKIEADRSKRREYIEKQEEKKKQEALVPVSKVEAAPIGTRTLVLGPQTAARIPAVTERATTIWPGMAQFHTRRARNVAKAYPQMAYETYLNSQQYGIGPARSSRGTITQYGGQRRNVSGYPADMWRMNKAEGRIVSSRGAKAMNVYQEGPSRRSYSTASMQSGTSYITTASQPTVAYPSMSTGGASVTMSAAPSYTGTPIGTSTFTVSATPQTPLVWAGDTFNFFGAPVEAVPSASMPVATTPMTPMPFTMPFTPQSAYRAA